MMRSVRFILFLVISLTSSVTGNAESKQSIIVIGDSLGVGLGARLSQLSSGESYNFKNYAIIGTNIKQWSKWCKNRLKESNPIVVYVSLGTNDALMDKVSLEHLEENIIKIQECVHSYNATVIWIGPPLGPSRLKYLESVKGTIRKLEPQYFDSDHIKYGRSEDGIHYTSDGYKKWAEEIWSWSKANKSIP